jgi:hypothetical protein
MEYLNRIESELLDYIVLLLKGQLFVVLLIND